LDCARCNLAHNFLGVCGWSSTELSVRQADFRLRVSKEVSQTFGASQDQLEPRRLKSALLALH
jgi:hypothetical protein